MKKSDIDISCISSYQELSHFSQRIERKLFMSDVLHYPIVNILHDGICYHETTTMIGVILLI